MTATAQGKPAATPGQLSGAEKVAVLLLSLGKSRAAKVLKRFDPEELRLLAGLSGDLRPMTAPDLEALVEEFAQRFSTGVKFVGTEREVKSLLSGVFDEDELADVADQPEKAEGGALRIWDKVSGLKDDVLRAYLAKEHSQTVALILSRINSDAAAKVIAAFPADVRNGLLCRMLAIGPVSDDALRAVESALAEDLAAQGSASHAGIADILNRLDKSQSGEVLQSLAEIRPEDAKALKKMLFTFEELVTLQPRARSLVFDQIPIERLVLALRGTDPAFQATILSSLAARSKRMVEAELQGGSTASSRDIAEARRGIVDTVLKMIATGEIELQTDDALDEITA